MTLKIETIMGKVLIAKSSKKDIKNLEKFLELAEFLFSGKEIEGLNIDDPTKILYNKIIWDSDFIDPKSSPAEIRYEMLQRAFCECSGTWMKVVNTAAVMEDQICDPHKSYLSFNPSIKKALEDQMIGE